MLRRLVQQQGWRDAFYKADGKGGWRAPAVNETCCARINLADLLDAIGAQGPDALYLRHGNDLAAEIQAAGGIVTAEDLQSATVVVKDPLVIRVRPATALCSFRTLGDCESQTDPVECCFCTVAHSYRAGARIHTAAPATIPACDKVEPQQMLSSGSAKLDKGSCSDTWLSPCACCAGQGAADAGAAPS